MEREEWGSHGDRGFQRLKECALHQASGQHGRHDDRE
jgi:hypothetical protein